MMEQYIILCMYHAEKTICFHGSSKCPYENLGSDDASGDKNMTEESADHLEGILWWNI